MNQPDAQNMQSYPSPNAIAADSSNPFYPSASQQQAGLSMPTDLQLAARLSRGLAPMINTGGGGDLPDGQQQSSQSNVNHQYEHNNQSHVADLRSSNEPVDHVGMQYGTPDGSMVPRKRSKVSRACDECRRKKIRCDATGEEGDANCSSCKRVGARCQFSRVPMKRGPSKGYIKELADRLHNLEGAMHAGEIPINQYLQPHDNPSQQRRGSDEFSSPPPTDNMSRKRTFSTTSGSGDFPSPYLTHRSNAGFPPQELPRQPSHPPLPFSAPQSVPTAHMFRDPNYSPNGLQPVPQWRNAPEPTRRQSVSLESVFQAEYGVGEYVADWDDSVLDGYYNLIHPTFPLLSSSKAHLSSQVANCTSLLREAFYEALHAAVRSFPSATTAASQPRSTKKVTQLIAASQMDSVSSRTFTTNLVYLQSMLLMVVEASNRGSPSSESSGTALQSVWLGSAVGLAYSMHLHIRKPAEKHSATDIDSEDRLARRVWWSLVIMDRWNAWSTTSPFLIPETSVILYPADVAVLGEAMYHLGRLSIVLGHFSAIDLVPSDLPALALPPVPILGMLMRGELERCRETLPSLLLDSSNAPLIHLSYYILSIQMLLRLPAADPYEILAPATDIVALLTQHPNFLSPLTHHATALAALTLVELTKYETTREQADSGLNTLLEGRIAPSGWDSAIREMILKKQRSGSGGSDPSAGKHSILAAQGLRHLADLATATKEGTAADESRNDGEKVGAISEPVQRFRGLRAALKTGYLTHLGG